ncbi:MAG: hypothetical protein PVJ86_12735, partial [Phycisphaerales bacterium]
DEEERHPDAGEQEDKGKDDPAYTPGCPQRQIVVVIAMQVKRQKAATGDTAQIDEKKYVNPRTQFNESTNGIEAEHVEEQVHPVEVQEPTREQAVVLPIPQDAYGTEYVPIPEARTGEPPI